MLVCFGCFLFLFFFCNFQMFYDALNTFKATVIPASEYRPQDGPRVRRRVYHTHTHTHTHTDIYMCARACVCVRVCVCVLMNYLST